jgi:hypothetical protein
MDVNYGFVDANNLLIGNAFCVEGDTQTIERVKSEFNAVAYYPIGDVITRLNESVWMGSYFTPQKYFPSWIWDESLMDWQPPTPYPSGDKFYDWNEDTLSWDLSPEQ